MSLKKLVGKDVTVLLDGRQIYNAGVNTSITAIGTLENYTRHELLFSNLWYRIGIDSTRLENVTINREYVILIGQQAAK